jgi:hypothetical protein
MSSNDQGTEPMLADGELSDDALDDVAGGYAQTGAQTAKTAKGLMMNPSSGSGM